MDDCAFMIAAPKLWNSLPLNIRQATTIDTFERSLKTYLFAKTFINYAQYNITRDMCFPRRGTQIRKGYVFLCMGNTYHWEYMFLGRATHITREIRNLGKRTHFTKDIYFPVRGTHTTRNTCS